MVNWPWNYPHAETRRVLRFVPMPDITPIEVAYVVCNIEFFNRETKLSKEDLAASIPAGCGRHFTIWETLYEVRGSRRTPINGYQVFVVAPQRASIPVFTFPNRGPSDAT